MTSSLVSDGADQGGRLCSNCRGVSSLVTVRELRELMKHFALEVLFILDTN